MSDQTSRVSPEARLSDLRDAWIAAENQRTKAYHALLAAHSDCPFKAALDEAEKREKMLRSKYQAALSLNRYD